MNKLKLFAYLTLLSVLFLTGCYDSKEIDETAYLIALGIDTARDGGYAYTLQFSAPLATVEGGGGGSGEKGGEETENPTVRNIEVTAPDFYTAKNMVNNFLSKSVDMSHLKLIVFSKTVDQSGFLKHSQFLLREREIRPNTAVALAAGSAGSFLKAVNPELEANTAKHYELMSMHSNNVYSPTKRLSEFVDEINSPDGVSILPIARTKDTDGSEDNGSAPPDSWVSVNDTKISSERAELRGMAILKGGEVVCTDSGSMAMTYNLLTRAVKSCTIALKNPNSPSEIITFRLTVPQRASYKLDNTKKPCRITVSQGFDIEFFGGFLPRGFSSAEQLYSYARFALTQRFSEYFYDLSQIRKADIMEIGDCFKKQFLTDSQWQAADWNTIYETCEFNIDIHFV